MEKKQKAPPGVRNYPLCQWKMKLKASLFCTSSAADCPVDHKVQNPWRNVHPCQTRPSEAGSWQQPTSSPGVASSHSLVEGAGSPCSACRAGHSSALFFSKGLSGYRLQQVAEAGMAEQHAEGQVGNSDTSCKFTKSPNPVILGWQSKALMLLQIQ